MACKKFMVKQGLEHGSPKSHAGAAGGNGSGVMGVGREDCQDQGECLEATPRDKTKLGV